MARIRPTVGVFILALTAGVGCHDSPTAPPPQILTGTYVLRSIAGQPVPVTYYSGADGTYSVLADTVQFVDDRPVDGDVHARLVEVVRVTGSSYGPDTTYRYVVAAGYRVSDGNRIEIGWFGVCGPSAICAPNDTGRLVQDGLHLGSSRTGTWAAWSFARVDIATPLSSTRR